MDSSERNSDNERSSKKTEENPNWNKNQSNQSTKYDDENKRTEKEAVKPTESGSKVKGGFEKRQEQSVEYKKGGEQKRSFTSTAGSNQTKHNANTQDRKQATFQHRNDSGRQSDNIQRNMHRKGESQDGRWTKRNDEQVWVFFVKY